MTDTQHKDKTHPTGDETPNDPDTLHPEVVQSKKRLPARDDQAEIMEWVKRGKARVADNSEAIQERIIANILRAESPDEVLGDNVVESVQNIVGELIEVEHFDLNVSEYEDGIGYYAVMDVTIAKDGRRTTVQCGAPQVVLQLQKLEALGAMPVVCMVVELASAKSGHNAPLGLRLPGPADKVSRTVAGTEGDDPF